MDTKLRLHWNDQIVKFKTRRNELTYPYTLVVFLSIFFITVYLLYLLSHYNSELDFSISNTEIYFESYIGLFSFLLLFYCTTIVTDIHYIVCTICIRYAHMSLSCMEKENKDLYLKFHLSWVLIKTWYYNMYLNSCTLYLSSLCLNIV